ncbi:MAG: hypothetical protein ABIP78_07835 [Pyrinomonadaceae bacterium]
MREGFFIILVVFGLLALTALRYRKQIGSMIGMARMLKEAKENITSGPNIIQGDNGKNVALVNCSKCGVWVPQNKARKVGDTFFCSDECVRVQKPARR